MADLVKLKEISKSRTEEEIERAKSRREVQALFRRACSEKCGNVTCSDRKCPVWGLYIIALNSVNKKPQNQIKNENNWREIQDYCDLNSEPETNIV